MVLNLSKAMLDCMQELRRRLRNELSVSIRLSDDNAVQALLEACRLSDSIRTRELGIELAHMTGMEAGDLAGTGVATHSGEASQPPAVQGETLVRIYRGQRVYG